ncbi:MAG: Peptidase family [Flavipsychrobacter sp.]|jgi:predicted Zn-dependent protease|nr:Peptidase family [Flavipsychrobacter sp.]
MKMRLSSQFAFFVCLVISVLFASCFYKNPVTGRRSLALVDDASVLSVANQQYTTFLSTNPPVQNANAEMVKRVGSRMSTAVAQYLGSIGQASLIKDYRWEYNLVNNAEVNAWCMPGGKVVVYSGILPLTQDETGLAVVMGHEIAHAVAKHGNERMSDQLVAQYGGVALSQLLSGKPAETQKLFNTAYGVGSTLGVLAYSRKHESEADEMGLYFMAMAGYDPNAAIGFWQRMAAKSGGKPPEFLSTHPSDQTRINDIKKLLPKAMTYYKK